MLPGSFTNIAVILMCEAVSEPENRYKMRIT